MERLEFKEADENNVGFMGGSIKGFHKFTRTKDNKEGVIYCDGMGNFKEIFPEDLTWDSKTEFTTKPTAKNITVTKNVMA